MSRTVITSETTQIVVDNSLVFDDTAAFGGVPTILRGTTIIAQENGSALLQAGRYAMRVGELGSRASKKLAIIDGGLALVPRMLGVNTAGAGSNGGYAACNIFEVDANLAAFTSARYSIQNLIGGAYTEIMADTGNGKWDIIVYDDPGQAFDQVFLTARLNPGGKILYPAGEISG